MRPIHITIRNFSSFFFIEFITPEVIFTRKLLHKIATNKDTKNYKQKVTRKLNIKMHK